MSIEQVLSFHRKFNLPCGDQDEMTAHLIDYRSNFMQEELNEFLKGVVASSRVDQFDALLDLVYVAHGTALMMGINPAQWNAGMAAVHKANMSKERCRDASESKRDSPFDVRKPEGWVGPEETLRTILGETE